MPGEPARGTATTKPIVCGRALVGSDAPSVHMRTGRSSSRATWKWYAAAPPPSAPAAGLKPAQARVRAASRRRPTAAATRLPTPSSRAGPTGRRAEPLGAGTVGPVTADGPASPPWAFGPSAQP